MEVLIVNIAVTTRVLASILSSVWTAAKWEIGVIFVSESEAFQRSVEFEYEGHTILAEFDLWPDGDAPENWTLDDVIAVITKSGGSLGILKNWDLMYDLTLNIREGAEGRFHV